MSTTIPSTSGGKMPRWACPHCTLLNETDAKNCEACGGSRPIGVVDNIRNVPAVALKKNNNNDNNNNSSNSPDKRRKNSIGTGINNNSNGGGKPSSPSMTSTIIDDRLNWRAQFESWKTDYEHRSSIPPSIPIELISVGESTGSLVLSVGKKKYLIVIKCPIDAPPPQQLPPTQNTSSTPNINTPNKKTDDTKGKKTSTISDNKKKASTTSSPINPPSDSIDDGLSPVKLQRNISSLQTSFSVEINDDTTLDTEINLWITDHGEKLTLSILCDKIVDRYAATESRLSLHSSSSNNHSSSSSSNNNNSNNNTNNTNEESAFPDDGWGDEELPSLSDESEWGKLERHESDGGTGGWSEIGVDDSSSLLLSVVDSSFEKYKKLKQKWKSKEIELRSKSKQKSIFDEQEYRASKKQIFTAAEVSMMLMNTLISIMKKSITTGIEVEAVHDNIFHWRVKFSRFPSDSQLSFDLVKLDSLYNRSYVELDVKFDMNLFPFYPPDVRPVYPRLENFFMGRIVCMDELMLSKWSPVRQLTDIFTAIHRLLSLYGSVDTANPQNDPRYKGSLYPESEYQLWRLSMLTEIAPRANVLQRVDRLTVSAANSSIIPPPPGPAKREASWTKKDIDTIENYISNMAAQRKKTQEILTILGVLVAELAKPSVNSIFVNMISSSCILPFIQSYLSIEDIIDVERKIEIFNAVFMICRGLSAHKELVNVFRLTKLSTTNGGKTLWHYLEFIRNKIKKECSGKQSDPLSPNACKLVYRVCDEVEKGLALASAALAAELDEAVIGGSSSSKRSSIGGKDEKEANDFDSQCPLCSRYFPRRTFEQHVQICLSAKDDKDEVEELKREGQEQQQDHNNNNIGGGGKDKIKSSKLLSEGGSVECPICAKGFSISEIESHAAICVETKQVETDEIIARSISDGGEEKKSDEKLSSTSKIISKKKTSTSLPTSTTFLKKDKSIDKTALSEKTRLILERIEAEEKARMATLPNGDRECPICQLGIAEKALDSHINECWKCTICCRAHLRSLLIDHVAECIKRGGIDEDEKINIHFTRKEQGLLNTTQLKAVQWVQKQAQKMSEEKHPQVIEKFKKLGKTEEDLKTVLRFIRNEAPIIVHVQLDECLKFLLKDTHYRNQFETNTSHGTLSHSTRTGWEDRMFNSLYHNTPGFERVKYGVLNMSNSPSGVRACKAYGDSYLLMNQNVRLRTTFANMDTGCDQAILATCEYYEHILASYTDQELQDLIDVATGKKPYMDSAATSTYKEIQIHGDLKLNRDVKAIMVNKRHKNDCGFMAQIKQFCEKNHCPYMFIDL